MPPPIVCLPGLLCTVDVFDDVPMLASPSAIRLDLPRLDDFSRMADQLVSSIPERCILLGMSMGSYLCLEIYRRRPDGIAAMILIGTAAGADDQAAAARRRKIAEWAMKAGEDALAGAVAESTLGRRASSDKEVRSKLSLMAHRVGCDTFRGHQIALTGRPDNTALLPRTSCPVLIMAGAEDRLTPPAVAEAMTAAIPDSRLRIVPDAAHMPVMENPAMVEKEITAFLSEKLGYREDAA